VEQSANTGNDPVAGLAASLDLARNQFRARQVAEASATADRLIAALDALLTGPGGLSEGAAALAQCIKACALTLQGRCLEEQGHPAEGLDMWKRAVAMFAENRAKGHPSTDMLGYYGAALRMTDDRQGAIAIFKGIVEAGAAVPETYRHYGLALKDEGLVLKNKGLLEEARAQLKIAVEVAPSDLRGLRGLAEVCEILGGEAEKKEAARAYYGLAEAQSAAGDYARALDAATNSLRLDESNPKIYSLRGDLLRIVGRYEEALASLDRYLAVDPDNPVALASKGAALYSLHRYEEAMAALNRAIEMRPNYAWALGLLGKVFVEKGALEEAAKAFRTAFNLAPSFRELASELARVHLLLNRPDKALGAADRALALKNDDPFALSMRGLALNQLERFDEAIGAFDQAIKAAPGYAFAWSRKALPLFYRDRAEEALATLDRAIEIEPGDAWSYGRKGEFLSRSRDPEKRKEAIPLLKKAVALGSDADDAARLARTLETVGLLEEAVLAANQAIAIDGRSVEAYLTKADALRRLERPDEWLNAVDLALELAPDSAYALGTRGQILHDLDRDADAEKFLREAAAKDKGLPWVWEQLGEVLYRLNRPEEALAALQEAQCLGLNDRVTLQYKAYSLTAVAHNLHAKGDNTAALERLQQAIEAAPDYATAHALRGLVLRAQGKYADAEQALSKAVELGPDLAWAHAELASACRDLGKPDKALAAVDEALRLKKDNYASAAETKALILIDIGENQLAVDLCEQALAADGSLWTSHYWRGLGLDNMGRIREALAAYQQAYGRSPDDVWTRRALADMLILAGAPERGREHFGWIIGRMSNQIRGPIELSLCGWCHYGCDRLDPAIRLYSEAVSQDPDAKVKSSLFDLALIIGCSKRYARAQREYERAIEVTAAAHPWLRKGILGVAVSDLMRAMTIRHPHLAESAEIKHCMERLQAEYQRASDEPSRPQFTQPVKLQPA
jgi:superkiller protein 3